MRRRSYTLPVLLLVFLIAGTYLLASWLSKDPYDKAMEEATQAMADKNYTMASSHYRIAQELREHEVEPYIKDMEAIAYSNSTNTVRYMLTAINNCIDYCGEDSVSPEYIAELMDVLVANGNGEQAYQILSHINYILANTEPIQAKFNEISAYALGYTTPGNGEIITEPTVTQ